MEILEQKKKKWLAVLLYTVFGVYLLIRYNYNVAIMYFTTIPTCLLLWYLAYKIIKNRVVAVYLFLLFLAQGINPFLFFIYKDRYPMQGYNSVGTFSFSIVEYFKVFKTIAIYSSIIILVSAIWKIITRARINGNDNNSVTTQNTKKYSINLYDTNLKVYSGIVLVASCLLGSLLSIIMYNHQIGVLGFESIQLPYKLVGILFYGRLLILNGIVLVTYILSQNRLLFIPVCIYAYIITLTSNSKLCGLGVLTLVVIYEFLYGKKIKSILLMFYEFLVYNVLENARYIIYSASDDGKYIDPITGRSTKIINMFHDVFTKSLLYAYEFVAQLGEKLLEIFHDITSRLFGAQILVICSQYQNLESEAISSFFKGASIYEIYPNILSELLGVEAVAMGYSFGHIGDIVLVSNGMLKNIVLIAVIIGILLNIFEAIMKKIEMLLNAEIGTLLVNMIITVVVTLLWISIIDIAMFYYILLFASVILSTMMLYKKYIAKRERNRL